MASACLAQPPRARRRRCHRGHRAFEDETPAADPEGEGPGEFADDGHDEAGALESVYGPGDAGELTEAAE